MSTGIWILIAVVGVGVVALVNIMQRNAQQRKWADIATQLGLVCSAEPIRMTGTYRGHEVMVQTLIRYRSGPRGKRHRHHYAHMQVKVKNPGALSLVIYRESIFDQAAKWVGAVDIQLGDEALDKQYVFKGQPESEVVRLLAFMDVRQKLREFPWNSIEIQNGTIQATDQGILQDAENLKKALDPLCVLAEALERIGGVSNR